MNNTTPYNTRANAAAAGARSTTTTTVPAATHPGNTAGVATTTTTTTTKPTNPLKAAVAAVHGVGEVVRGTVNGAVEGAFNESGGVAKSNATTSAGIDEIETGKFSAETKQREGVLPGSDHGVRRGI